MKIVVTYETKDLTRLIRQDLALQGITATDADIKFVKSIAVVAVEVTPEEKTPDDFAALAAKIFNEPPPAPYPPPPSLAVVEGGAAPADMSDILNASKKITNATSGKFPVPQHDMLPGESAEWPGDKR